MNIDPQEYSAALILNHRAVLEDFSLRHIIDRLFADYRLSHLNIYFNPGDYPEIYYLKKENINFTECLKIINIKESLIFKISSKFHEKEYPLINFIKNIKSEKNLTMNAFPESHIIDIDFYGRSRINKNTESNQNTKENRISDFQTLSFEETKFSGNFIYYPFFPMFRADAEAGVHPFSRQYQDAFGFRLKQGQTLSSWPDNRRLVILYGGSAAYSLYNSFHLGLAAQIENIVNDTLGKKELPANIDVLSLAAPGGTVMEAIILHTLFGARLKPEQIILHFGWNECRAALSSDEPSCSANIIHTTAAWDFLELQNRMKNPDRSLPTLQRMRRLPSSDYLQPVLERTLQLANLASGSGAGFTVGLQPALFARDNPHPAERDYFTKYLSKSPGFAENMKRHSDCFSWISSALQKEAADLDFIDLNPFLRDIPDDRLCFFDPCHMTPSGYQAIAGAYADSILQKLCQQGEKT